MHFETETLLFAHMIDVNDDVAIIVQSKIFRNWCGCRRGDIRLRCVWRMDHWWAGEQIALRCQFIGATGLVLHQIVHFDALLVVRKQWIGRHVTRRKQRTQFHRWIVGGGWWCWWRWGWCWRQIHQSRFNVEFEEFYKPEQTANRSMGRTRLFIVRLGCDAAGLMRMRFGFGSTDALFFGIETMFVHRHPFQFQLDNYPIDWVRLLIAWLRCCRRWRCGIAAVLAVVCIVLIL